MSLPVCTYKRSPHGWMLAVTVDGKVMDQCEVTVRSERRARKEAKRFLDRYIWSLKPKTEAEGKVSMVDLGYGGLTPGSRPWPQHMPLPSPTRGPSPSAKVTMPQGDLDDEVVQAPEEPKKVTKGDMNQWLGKGY